MKTVTLKEAHAPYVLSLDDASFIEDAMILEKNGEPIAALVPMIEYNAFQSWRQAEARRQIRQSEEAAIAREHQIFQEMLPSLLKQYAGRVVAIYQGQVIAVGDDRMLVWQQARQRVGSVPIYVQTVETPPKTYKMPYRKVIARVDLI